MKKSLTIIILNYNGTDDTIACVQSLDKIKTNYTYRTVILDNNSDAVSYQKLENYCKKRTDYETCLLEEFPKVLKDINYMVRSSENYGFARGNNEIIKRVMYESRYVLLLNNDTEVEPAFIEEMMEFLKKNDDVKYASCRINNYYQKDLLWSCGGILKFWGHRHGYTESELVSMDRIIDTPYITGCALFLDTKMLQIQGLLSEDFFFGEEDFNFSWRMKKAGVRGACLNETLVYHKVSQSSRQSGNTIGKTAGYYANRIIDMHKFYRPVIWHIWKAFMMLFVSYTCIHNHKMNRREVKQVLKLIRQHANNTKLTKEDCLNMHRF